MGLSNLFQPICAYELAWACYYELSVGTQQLNPRSAPITPVQTVEVCAADMGSQHCADLL